MDQGGVHSVVVPVMFHGSKERNGPQGKAFIYFPIYVPALPCGHELFVMTKRIGS